MLSATSPLLQAWYLRTKANVIPYRLFALSNFGSMLALLSYPFLVEPNITLRLQARLWSVAFAAFAVACGVAAWKSRGGTDVLQAAAQEDAPPPRFSTILLWISLAACASTLLLATTSHLTQNVAPIPLLWIAPLSIYLLTFILSFESDKIYQSWLFLPLGLVALGVFTYGMSEYENNTDVIKRLIPMLCGALFIACMVCHGELAKRKPHPRYLTLFFLMVSLGGAIGGLFVALLAPRIFPNYWEMPIAITALGVLIAIVLSYDDAGAPRPLAVRASLLIVALSFGVYLARLERRANKEYILAARNFYGVLRVRDDPPDEGTGGVRVLIHGTINHGTQILGPGGGRIPTSYFGDTSGISRAIHSKGEKGPIRIGILGLGAGVTATLARAGDTLHYYEINPLVFQIAQTKFDFWKDCPADKHLYFGDGRLTLERMQASENLDFLAMDAFTSDAVPMHLLTLEAYATYARHMKPDGILAVNISNRYLDLEPIMAQAAKEMGWSGVVVYDEGTSEPYYVSNTWVLLSKSPAVFAHPDFQDGSTTALQVHQQKRVWTDDYSNILQILR